jgi:hypothetical protein
VYPVVVDGRVGLSGGGQVVGAAKAQRRGRVESVECFDRQTGWMSVSQGRWVVNDRLLAAAVAAV